MKKEQIITFCLNKKNILEQKEKSTSTDKRILIFVILNDTLCKSLTQGTPVQMVFRCPTPQVIQNIHTQLSLPSSLDLNGHNFSECHKI